MTETEPAAWPLHRILTEVAVGSGDWSWDQETAHLERIHTDQLAALREDIAANGITTPVLIGSDGRLWDGHHRVVAARQLGLDEVPVRIAAPGGLAEYGARVSAPMDMDTARAIGARVAAGTAPRRNIRTHTGGDGGLREEIARVLAERFTSPGRHDKPVEERLDHGMMRLFTASDGHGSMAPPSPREAADAVMAVVEPDRARLRAEMDRCTDLNRQLVKDVIAAEAAEAALAVNPPGGTGEVLPADILARITTRQYLSTACDTAQALAAENIDEHAARLHKRCRRNHKFTGALCVCECHNETQEA